MKEIVFITTGQPTTNPRLVKEAEILIKLGFNVKVICCFYQEWAREFDVEIIKRNPGVYIYCGGDPVKSELSYYKTTLRQKISNRLASLIKGFGFPENAISRTHAEALQIARRLKAELYIAHNLGALPAAVMAAKYHNAKVGYDAEDLNSGQYASVNDAAYILNKYIEEKYFPATNYITAASPLIGDYYKRIYPYLQPVVVNNVFPKVEFPFRLSTNKSLKLLWFSQTIGTDRGLEIVIEALGRCKQNVELHLVGSVSDGEKSRFQDLAATHQVRAEQLQFHAPISPDKLLTFAANFDAGLATETTTTLNRDICITNKVFTYLQCGLALIASDTQAQAQFLASYPQAGLLFKKDNATELAQCIDRLISNTEMLKQIRLHNYQLGQSALNWEHESRSFVKLVNDVLSDYKYLNERDS